MFYAHFVLAKKGPLARIWLAAHWDKKLTKAHVFETNIESSVEGILQPKVKMALRTSGHLLLGIVRIYSRKAKYLLADCNEAFIKIKMAFRPGVVDLPEGKREAAVATITLPELFHDFETTMPEITNVEVDECHHQSRAEDITIKEDYGNFSLADDNTFDMGFDDGMTMNEAFDNTDLFPEKDKDKEQSNDMPSGSQSSINLPCTSTKHDALNAPLEDDGFGGAVGQGLLEGDGGDLFDEPAGNAVLFSDVAKDIEPHTSEPAITDDGSNAMPSTSPRPAPNQDDSDDDIYDGGPPSFGPPSPPSSPESPGQPEAPMEIPAPEETAQTEEHMDEGELPPPLASDALQNPNSEPPLDQTTLIHNEEETFALAPLDSAVVQGAERAKAKRKRKLIVDEVKNISGEEMKAQLSDTTDIVTTLDLAPPTKRLMHWKETGGVEKLFALPGKPILSKTLSRLYQRHLTTRAIENDDFNMELDKMELATEMEPPREEEIPQHVLPPPPPPPPPAPAPVVPHQPAQATPVVSSTPVQPRKRRREMNVEDDYRRKEQQHAQPMDNSIHHQFVIPQNPDHMHPTGVQMPTPVDQLIPNVPPHMMMPEQPPVVISPPMQTVGQMPMQIPVTNAVTVMPPDNSVIQDTSRLSEMSVEKIRLTMSNDSLPNLPNTSLEASTAIASSENISEYQACQSELSFNANTHPQPNLSFVEAPRVNESFLQPREAALDKTFDSLQQETQSSLQQLPPQSDLQQPLQSPAPLQPQPQDQLQESFQEAEQQPQQQELQQETEETEDDVHHDEVELSHEKEGDADAVQNEELNAKAQLQQDDDDDYAAPASVGPPEEQMADETYEQFEERILNKRTVHMLHLIHHSLESGREVHFEDLVRNNRRKQVAQKFYTFLVLKKQQAVELKQDQPYGDLIITRGPKYSTV